MISNCGKDENGSYAGGAAGDQTGAEWWCINWYNGSWKCVLRHPNSKICSEIADLAVQAADNDNIGYDQGQRLTFWQELQRAGFQPKNIMTQCEADCSSGVMSIIKAVGYLLGIDSLRNVDPGLTTWDIRAALRSVGFTVIDETRYLTSDDYLRPGDILLNDSSHVCIQVSTGSKAQAQETIVVHSDGDGALVDISDRAVCVLQYGTGLNDPDAAVLAWQALLGIWGLQIYDDDGELIVMYADGEFGEITEAYTTAWQNTVGLPVTGIVDEDDWTAVIRPIKK